MNKYKDELGILKVDAEGIGTPAVIDFLENKKRGHPFSLGENLDSQV